MKLAVILLAFMTITIQAQSELTKVTRQPFGKTPNGTPVELYTLKSGKIEARIMTYGGVLQSLQVPDRHGKEADVVLGFDSLSQYVKTGNPAYFGATIGRFANRIAHGKFTLDGKTYTLPVNNGVNSLHGGVKGFDKVVWNAKEIKNGIELTHISKDGDQGYPGTLSVTVRYTLQGNELLIDYSATTDKDTILNLTNHSYFNLAGQGNGTILPEELKINASHYTPTDATQIPTGEIAPVAGTPFDFRKLTEIGARINENNEQLHFAKGYDDNWVLDSQNGKMAEAAEVYDRTTGRVLTVYTTEPGLQFYTGNYLDGTLTGKDGKVYKKHYGLTLETQHYPDAPNHPNFPTTELKPGQHFHSTTVLRFSTR